MKGKNTFKTDEFEEIKQLISEKVQVAKEQQNKIRTKIRKIGFYYSDFSSSKHGYTVADLESLKESHQITINNDRE